MKIIIKDCYGNELCSFNVYNSHHYYDDDVEIEKESLNGCDIKIPQVAIDEFHQLRNDDADFSEHYSEDDLKEWYEEHAENSLNYNGYGKVKMPDGNECIIIQIDTRINLNQLT